MGGWRGRKSRSVNGDQCCIVVSEMRASHDHATAATAAAAAAAAAVSELGGVAELSRRTLLPQYMGAGEPTPSPPPRGVLSIPREPVIYKWLYSKQNDGFKTEHYIYM